MPEVVAVVPLAVEHPLIAAQVSVKLIAVLCLGQVLAQRAFQRGRSLNLL